MNRLIQRYHQLRSRVAPETWRLIIVLAFASGLAVFLLALRIVVTGRIMHLFLPWNLFLAWLPLGFALRTLQLAEQRGWRDWRTGLAAAGWLLFFPNAPYIFTDLVHLRDDHDHRFWIDLILILLFAWPGFLVGCLSLRLLHERVTHLVHPLAGWFFAAACCGLAGVGVYIGRFLRWNSWDVVINPLGLFFDALGFLGHPITHPAYRFSALFAVLLFVGYATLQTQMMLNRPQATNKFRDL